MCHHPSLTLRIPHLTCHRSYWPHPPKKMTPQSHHFSPPSQPPSSHWFTAGLSTALLVSVFAVGAILYKTMSLLYLKCSHGFLSLSLRKPKSLQWSTSCYLNCLHLTWLTSSAYWLWHSAPDTQRASAQGHHAERSVVPSTLFFQSLHG